MTLQLPLLTSNFHLRKTVVGRERDLIQRCRRFARSTRRGRREIFRPLITPRRKFSNRVIKFVSLQWTSARFRLTLLLSVISGPGWG